MKAKPLSKSETKWLNRLEKVMGECPSKRLACFTTGDNQLDFYDNEVSSEWESKNRSVLLDAGELHERAGSKLRAVSGNFIIDSCAG